MYAFRIGRAGPYGSALVISALALTLFVSAAGVARADGGQDAWLESVFGAKHPTKSRMMRLGAGPGEKEWTRSKARRRAGSSAKGVQVASLGSTIPESAPQPSLTGGGPVRWVASASCLAGNLRAVIAEVASFGSVTVSSTCRSHSHNRRVGGARRSHHLTGNAVDFRIRGNIRAAFAYLRSSGLVGGLKHYGGGLFHIDTGARRSW